MDLRRLFLMFSLALCLSCGSLYMDEDITDSTEISTTGNICDETIDCQWRFVMCTVGNSQFGVCNECWPHYITCLSKSNSLCYIKGDVQDGCIYNWDCSADNCKWPTNEPLPPSKGKHITLILIMTIAAALLLCACFVCCMAIKNRRIGYTAISRS